MRRARVRTSFKGAILALIMSGVCATSVLAQYSASALVGSWQSVGGQMTYLLILNGDGEGSLNGNAVRWEYNKGVLVLALAGAQDSSKYTVSITPTTLSLSQVGNDTQPARVFQRVSAETGKSNKAAENGFAFAATFPPGWTRHDLPGYQIARLHTDEYGTRDETLLMSRAEPLQGSMEETFARIWDRDVARGDAIRLVNQGLLSPERPQPLRRRLNNGLAVWYEGGEGRLLPNGGSCYVQLFVIPAGESVTPILAIYGITVFGTSVEDRAPVMQFLENLRPSALLPKTELFTAHDVAGHWELMLIASLASYYSSSTGAYLGDASSGGTEDLRLNPDGTYVESFVGKTPSQAWTNQESGVWKLEDTVLTLMPTKHSGKGPLQVQKYRVYGRGTFNGGLELLMGQGDGSRIPTDALESGATMEVASRGGALFRFKAKTN